MLHVLLTFWGSGMGHFPEDFLICVIYDAAAKGPLVVWDVPKHDIPRVCVCVWVCIEGIPFVIYQPRLLRAVRGLSAACSSGSCLSCDLFACLK